MSRCTGSNKGGQRGPLLSLDGCSCKVACDQGFRVGVQGPWLGFSVWGHGLQAGSVRCSFGLDFG